MTIIKRDETVHKFEKQNLVTITKGRKHYDVFKCSVCGIVGESINLNAIKVKSSYSADKVNNCIRETKGIKRIRITKCTASGRQFENLTPGSEHDIVTPPEGYKNFDRGVWVMGIGEPVKVLYGEFVEL